MSTTAKKANLEITGKHVKNTLYKSRIPGIILNNPDALTSMKNVICLKKNPLYGFSYKINPDSEIKYNNTILQLQIPTGSVLRYQLTLTKSDFDVNYKVNTFEAMLCMEGFVISPNNYTEFSKTKNYNFVFEISKYDVVKRVHER